MRKTKIICTVGPATDDENVLRSMIEKGMNVARLNFSHGEYDTHEARFNEVVKIRNELQMPVATLLDTKGPEIRLGDFENKNGVEIKDGEDFILTTKKCKGTAKKSYVNYDGLPKDVHPGTTILINDGIISLKVNKVIDKDIYCTVVDGGLLTDRKGVNVPDVNLNMPYLSKKDMDDLSFGKKMDLDFIAASFCRSATDITIMRNYLEAIGWKTPKIIAKIENRQGLDNIDEIIDVADGIMVARGDLGVEVPFEEIRSVQKKIIE